MVLQVSFYHRNVARQQQQQQQWLQKRRQENATRRLAGEEPLPEEDPALFKPIPEPSPLDVYLINNQVCKSGEAKFSHWLELCLKFRHLSSLKWVAETVFVSPCMEMGNAWCQAWNLYDSRSRVTFLTGPMADDNRV